MAKRNQGLNAAEIPIPAGKAHIVGEIRESAAEGIETLEVPEGASEGQLRQLMEDEMFMHEIVHIRIQTTTDKNAPVMALPQVNGVNQPIFRGIVTPVKRKYVEALARAKQTDYTQTVDDPRSPDKITMVPNTVLSFPFEVINDPNPKGRAWLESVLRAAA